MGYKLVNDMKPVFVDKIKENVGITCEKLLDIEKKTNSVENRIIDEKGYLCY